MKRFRRQNGPAQRRGTILPAIIVAIVVVCLLAALVFDRLWLDAARVELRTAAEAAALAAAARLSNDDRLRAGASIDAVLEQSRWAAVTIAADNRVAASPVRLDPTPGGDIRFGALVDDPHTGRRVFLETDDHPSTVLVTARAVRSRGNGVALFFRKLTGVASGNVIARAGATVDHAVVGVRPVTGSLVPALPLGILESDPLGIREDTWQRQITQQQGDDQYGYDETSHRVTRGADGIREIILRGTATDALDNNRSAQASPNVQVLDVGNGLWELNVRRQIAGGWSPDDLAEFGGQFLLDGEPQPVDGSTTLHPDVMSAFEDVIGQPRICVLYEEDESAAASGISRLQATRLIAGRILAIDDVEENTVQFVFQPTVITTRAAVLAREPDQSVENPYICKVHINH